MRRSPTKRFLFKLALELGWLNPYAMARRMPAKLLMEWMAYAAIEPFDGVRADYHAAQITQMLYNINRDSKTDPKGKPLAEFLLPFDAEELTDEERAERSRKELENKMRVQEIIARAMAEASAGSRQPLPAVHEHVYPTIDVVGGGGGKVTVETLQPMTVDKREVVDERERRALEAARAALRKVD